MVNELCDDWLDDVLDGLRPNINTRCRNTLAAELRGDLACRETERRRLTGDVAHRDRRDKRSRDVARDIRDKHTRDFAHRDRREAHYRCGSYSCKRSIY